MASLAVADTVTGRTQSPYRIDPDQTLKASQALLRHVQAEAKRLQEQSSKQNLLSTADSDSDLDEDVGDEPIWLNLTTKQHIVDRNRLKPSKVAVPYSLNKSMNLNICLIVADPQRAVKNIVADPAFPKQLSSRITKIIGYTKLKARYKSFESRRQLLSEHDIFLADDRIVTRLPETLGKVFYKATVKRPIPIRIAYQNREDGKVVRSQTKKPPKDERVAVFAASGIFAKEIESTLDTVPVSLKPGTMVAVRVGVASFKPQQLRENIVAVAQAVIERHVVKGWRNIKAIHIKSPTSAAIPIWLADDMWVSDDSVIDNAVKEEAQNLMESNVASKKRKRNPTAKAGPQAGTRKKAKAKETVTSAVTRITKLERQKQSVFGS